AAELVEQPLRDLEGAVVAPDLLAHQKHADVALHLFGQRLVERLAVHQLGHQRASLPAFAFCFSSVRASSARDAPSAFFSPAVASRGSISQLTSNFSGHWGHFTSVAPSTRARGRTSSSPGSTRVSFHSSSTEGSGEASANF